MFDIFEKVKLIKLKMDWFSSFREIENVPLAIREKVVYCDAVYRLEESEVKSIKENVPFVPLLLLL